MIGKTIAHYRVEDKIGAGGMGEVYRASDTRLNRRVALKFLREAFLAEPDRLARFEREAHVLASLNHPRIATIHGLEVSDGVRALVMELVEGPTLAERIAAGALPLDDALQIARQAAEALEYAHERGVVHRDLKPANIKVTADGSVKLLDFGLAKALDNSPAAADISQSPTLSMAATKAGIILGTAAYMSPEQAKGKATDRRADIWAFGAVLYEMLTGKQLYEGETASEVLAAVIMKDVDWAALPASTPRRIRELLERCLRKDPRGRLRDIGEGRIAIEEYLANPEAESQLAKGSGKAAEPQPAWQRIVPWALAAALGVVAVLAMWKPWQPPAAPPAPVRVNMDIGADGSLRPAFGPVMALSPDGSRLAYIAADKAGVQRLYVRKLDDLNAVQLADTQDARQPFFSANGQWIGFFLNGKLRKISVQGGAGVTLCDVPADERGGSWAENDTIVFAAASGPLLTVPSAGGTSQALTTLENGELTHRWPQFLPGGKAVLFTASKTRGNFDQGQVAVYSLESKTRKTLLPAGYHARYVSSGHIVYLYEQTLFAAPFDLQRLEITRQPTPVLERVMSNLGTGGAQINFSEAGHAVYITGSAAGGGLPILWLDRTGKLEPLRKTAAGHFRPRFSPDGKLLALEIRGTAGRDVWLYDWQRDTLTRLTTDADSGNPVWTAEGQRVTFNQGQGPSKISWKRTDGSGDAQVLLDSSNSAFPNSWHPSRRILAFAQQAPDTGWDIWMLPVEGDEKSGWKPGKPEVYMQSKFNDGFPVFSLDGRWLAYMSDETGAMEVYVRPFPGLGGKQQISNGGGLFPVWSRNGRELFYRTPLESRLMVVSYTAAGDSFRAGPPRLWSEASFTSMGTNWNFDLHPDGKRFAVLKSPDQQTDTPLDHVILILNFNEELRRKVPAAKK